MQAVVGDIGDPATRDALFEACPEPDILVNNNAGPNPGRFADWERDDWIGALDANMLTPLAMIRLVLDGMVERGFGRIVNITSAMVKSPEAPMGLSTGARAGLTSVAKALSGDVAAANVTINNLLPERFDTARQRQMAELHARMAGITVEQAYDHMKRTIAAGRLGRPERVRRGVCVPVQRPCRVHLGPEPAARRRQLRRARCDAAARHPVPRRRRRAGRTHRRPSPGQRTTNRVSSSSAVTVRSDTRPHTSSTPEPSRSFARQASTWRR